MDPKNGIEKRTAEENNMEDDRESEESEETEQFISAIEQQSLQEVLYIIATKGSIKLMAV